MFKKEERIWNRKYPLYKTNKRSRKNRRTPETLFHQKERTPCWENLTEGLVVPGFTNRPQPSSLPICGRSAAPISSAGSLVTPSAVAHLALVVRRRCIPTSTIMNLASSNPHQRAEVVCRSIAIRNPQQPVVAGSVYLRYVPPVVLLLRSGELLGLDCAPC